jgi:hypothetical protein
MNKTIWKYNLLIADDQTIDLPKNAQILTIQNQNGDSCLWALVNPKNDKEPRTILGCRDNNDIDTKSCTLHYISSAQWYSVVIHYFEKLPI